MGQVETYNGDEKKIIEHGNGLEPERRIKYYEDVINDLYVVHGAFKRDLYMGENTLRKKLEKEIEKAQWEIKSVEGLLPSEINNLVLDTFNFDYKKIRKAIEDLKDIKNKRVYLAFIKKELKRIIRCFESDRYATWKEKSEDCSERDKFVNERYKTLKEAYAGGKHDIDKYVEDDIKNKLAELKDCLANVDDEMEFIDSKGMIIDGRSINNSKKEKTDEKIIKIMSTDPGKEKCTKNKSEFARFIVEEYDKNKDNYRSLRDATYKIFEQYEFDDKKWTKEKCYDLVRKI